jgi:flagellar hook protein FlgE
LDANQSWLNVIGNNIANSNTTAFKASDVQFTPQFYVTDQPGTAPNGVLGGTNPSQEGLGTQIASIATDFTQGSIQSTGVPTDMAVSGAGFFVVNNVNGQQYTRDGTFSLNANNQLVASNGSYVQGYGADANGNIIQGALQNITVPIGQETIAKSTQNVTMNGNLNGAGAVASGSTILTSQAFSTIAGTVPTGADLLTNLVSTAVPPVPLMNVGDVLTLAGTQGGQQLPSNSMTVTATSTVSDLETFMNQSLGIDTTVAEPGNPTPGTTLQTTGTTAQLTVVGNTGSDNALTLGSTGLTDSSGVNPFAFAPGTDAGFTSGAAGESINTTINAYDSLGTPITVNLTAVLESKSVTGTTWRFYASSPDNEGGTGPVLGNGTISFNTQGQYSSSTGNTITVNRTGTGAGTPVVMNLNFSNMTDFAATTSQMVMASQDGSAVGTLSTFSVGGDGTITGSFTNGLTKTIGQMALANFDNPDGLVNEGTNLYGSSGASGVAQIGPPETLGTGSVESGALEQSNVDISKEFINLIIASTGFSANSRVISTSDQLLNQLLNSQGGA